MAPHMTLRACDLCDRDAVEAALRDIRPQQIYHLAGYAQVGRSFDEPDVAWSGNLTATRALYEATARWGGRPRILFVGSGLVYGDPDGPDQSQDENCLLRPNSPYAASKAAADLLSYQTAVNPGLDIVRARPFNHIGPRQSSQFAVANFARQAAAIERGELPPVLETGNLGSRRDMTDVRDTVAAYVLLMQKGRSGEAYNVGSGQNVVDANGAGPTVGAERIESRSTATGGVDARGRSGGGAGGRLQAAAGDGLGAAISRSTKRCWIRWIIGGRGRNEVVS